MLFEVVPFLEISESGRTVNIGSLTANYTVISFTKAPNHP